MSKKYFKKRTIYKKRSNGKTIDLVSISLPCDETVNLKFSDSKSFNNDSFFKCDDIEFISNEEVEKLIKKVK